MFDNHVYQRIMGFMENTSNTNTKSIIGFIVFLGVAVGAIALAMSNKKEVETPVVTGDENSTSTITATSTAEATTTASSTEPTALTEYKNGTFAATGTYKSPAGIEQVNISIEIENDIVVDSSFKGLAENSRSINFQEQFANGYRAQIIGKNIDSIALSKVSGSSLTPIGFNDALGKIKDEAERM